MLTMTCNFLSSDSFKYNTYNNHGVVGLVNMPTARFFNNSVYFIYGDFDSYKNDYTSNGSNYSFGIDSLVKDFTFSFYYYYFNANGLKDLDDDGMVFSISKKTSF